MVEELDPPYVRPGLHFDPAPVALDLYRLLCMHLADRWVMGEAGNSEIIRALRNWHIGGEVLRILISSAVTLRIADNQYREVVGDLSKIDCGTLWPEWPKRKEQALDLREACNKNIHAENIQRDIANPDPHGDPDNPDAYVLPHVYLYGKRAGVDWRAKLSIIDFVERATAVCFKIMGR